MIHCTWKIELEPSKKALRPGDIVAGKAVLTARYRCSCRELVITHGWGAGDESPSIAAPLKYVTYPGCDLEEGESHTITFEFHAPAGPPSYDGLELKITHYVRAWANVVHGGDSVAFASYVLRRGSEPWGNARPGRAVAAFDRAERSLVLPALGGMILGAGLFSLATLDARDATRLGYTIALMIGGLPPSIRVLPGAIAEWRVGPLSLSATEDCVDRSGCFTCALRLRPTRRVALEGVRSELTCTEVIVTGHGDHTSERRRRCHHSVDEQHGPATLEAGDDVTIPISVRIPEDAPYTFYGSSSSVVWSVTVTVAIKGAPDLHLPCTLIVRPSLLPEDRPAQAAFGAPKRGQVRAPRALRWYGGGLAVGAAAAWAIMASL